MTKSILLAACAVLFIANIISVMRADRMQQQRDHERTTNAKEHNAFVGLMFVIDSLKKELNAADSVINQVIPVKRCDSCEGNTDDTDPDELVSAYVDTVNILHAGRLEINSNNVDTLIIDGKTIKPKPAKLVAKKKKADDFQFDYPGQPWEINYNDVIWYDSLHKYHDDTVKIMILDTPPYYYFFKNSDTTTTLRIGSITQPISGSLDYIKDTTKNLRIHPDYNKVLDKDTVAWKGLGGTQYIQLETLDGHIDSLVLDTENIHRKQYTRDAPRLQHKPTHRTKRTKRSKI